MKPARKPLSKQRVEQLAELYDKGHSELEAQHHDTCLVCDSYLALRSKVREYIDMGRVTAERHFELTQEIKAMVGDEE